MPSLLPRYAARSLTLVELNDEPAIPFDWSAIFTGEANLTVNWPRTVSTATATGLSLIGTPTLRSQ